MSGSYSTPESYVDTQVKLLQSESLIEDVIDKLKLHKLRPTGWRAWNAERPRLDRMVRPSRFRKKRIDPADTTQSDVRPRRPGPPAGWAQFMELQFVDHILDEGFALQELDLRVHIRFGRAVAPGHVAWILHVLEVGALKLQGCLTR